MDRKNILYWLKFSSTYVQYECNETPLYTSYNISLRCVSILFISRYRNMRLSGKAFILEIILPHLQNCFVSCLMPSPYLAYKAFSINMSIMLIAYLHFDFAPSFSFYVFSKHIVWSIYYILFMTKESRYDIKILF